MRTFLKKLAIVVISAMVATALVAPAALAAPPADSGTTLTGATPQATALKSAKKAKTYWYSAGFWPKSYATKYGVKNAGCKAKTYKKTFKVTGRLYRATSLKSKTTLLSKKTRTFRVAKKVTHYGSAWTPSDRSKRSRADIMASIRTASKAKGGTFFFKVKNGKVVEVRWGA